MHRRKFRREQNVKKCIGGSPEGRRTNGNNFCIIPSPLQGSCRSRYDRRGLRSSLAHACILPPLRGSRPKYSYLEPHWHREREALSIGQRSSCRSVYIFLLVNIEWKNPCKDRPRYKSCHHSFSIFVKIWSQLPLFQSAKRRLSVPCHRQATIWKHSKRLSLCSWPSL